MSDFLHNPFYAYWREKATGKIYVWTAYLSDETGWERVTEKEWKEYYGVGETSILKEKVDALVETAKRLEDRVKQLEYDKNNKEEIKNG